MKRIAVFSTLFMLYVTGCSTGSIMPESPSEDVLRAAEAGLEEFAPMLNDLYNEPLSVRPERCTLGFAFRIYTIDPHKLINQADPDISAITLPIDTWRFAVVSDGTPIALLTVEKRNGEYKAVGIGATGLAKEMSWVYQDLQPKAYNLRFVRIYQATSDIIEATDTSTHSIQYAPLTSARISLGLDDPVIRSYSRGVIRNALISNEKTASALKGVVANALAD